MAGGAALKNPMSFNEAWPILQEELINNLIAYLDELEGLPKHDFCTSEEYMRFYTVVYNVSAPDPRSPQVEKLYDHYRKTFEDYISSKVLPSLRRKENEILLKELLKRWKNHKIMTGWLSRFFHYLSRYYIPLKKLPSLVETSNSIFYNLVFGEIKDQISDAIVTLIDRERESEGGDLALVAQVLDILEQIGDNASRNYLQDIEDTIVAASAKFCSRKALDWISTKSYDDYKLKVEECLEEEKNRVSGCLKLTNKNKVLEGVKHELLNVHRRKLDEMKASS